MASQLPKRLVTPAPAVANAAAKLLAATTQPAAKPVKTMLGIDLKRRIVGTVNALGVGLRIKVFFRGTRAYTNGAMIVLPAIRDLAEIPYETARALIGYAVHEVAHIRYTDFAEVARAYDGGKLVKKFQNCIEDYRIERIMSRAFPGSASDLTSLRVRIHPKLKSLTTGWLADPRACGPLALTWTGASLNNFANPHLQKTLDAIPDPVLALIRNWTDRMDDVQTTAETTDLAIAYADEAIRYAERTQAPQGAKQPKQDPASTSEPKTDGDEPEADPKPQNPTQGDASSTPKNDDDQDKADRTDQSDDDDDAPASDEKLQGAACGDCDGPATSGGEGEGDGDGETGTPQEIADHESTSENGGADDDAANEATSGDAADESDQRDQSGSSDADETDGAESGADGKEDGASDPSSDDEDQGDASRDAATDAEDGDSTEVDSETHPATDETDADATDGADGADADATDHADGEAGDDIDDDMTGEGFGEVSTDAEAEDDAGDGKDVEPQDRQGDDGDANPEIEESSERPAGKPKGDDRSKSQGDRADDGRESGPKREAEESQRPESDQSGVPEDQDDDDDDGPREGSADEVKDVHDEQDRESNGSPNQSGERPEEDPFASVLDPNAAFDDFLDDLAEAIREAGPLPQQAPEASDGEVDPGEVVDDVAEANEAAPGYDSDKQTANDQKDDPEKGGRGATKHDYDDSRFTPIDLDSGADNQYGDLKNAAAGTISTTARIIKRLLMAEERSGVLTNRRSGEFDIRNMSAIIRGTGNCYKKQWHRPAPRTLLATLVDFSGSMNYNMANPNSKIRPLTLAMMGALAVEEATRGTSIDTLLFGYTGASPTVHLYPFKDGRQGSMQTRRLIGAYDECNMGLTPTGEAMSAMALRMERAEQQRRILMVLTDGTADDKKLCAEVSNLMLRRGIEVVAIGINCDAVAEWAPVYHVINDISELPQALLATIDPRKARQAKRRVAA